MTNLHALVVLPAGMQTPALCTTGRPEDANKLPSVCSVLKDDSVAVSNELTVLLGVAAVPVAVLHNKESCMPACATMLRRCIAYLLARDAYLAHQIKTHILILLLMSACLHVSHTCVNQQA